MNWKYIFIGWAVVGAVSLAYGVTKFTFATMWLMYLLELYDNIKDDEDDEIES